ncbi:MAG TPA: hypothetical protein VGQ85_00850 [Candidatus Limnocylindrales bacterium]|nr:hypothetical protein [Candidatus Limnocylindrales bacterium]
MSPKRRTPSSIVDAISERFSANEDRPSFLQGLTLGALVGAAIAGSTLWNRWKRRRDRAEPGLRSTD